MNENERRPPIIPTEPPPPPPARAPEEPIEEPPPTVPPTERPRHPSSPDHAPSQRSGGRVTLKRKETPPEGTPVIIDRQRGSARAQAGIHSAGLAGVYLLG
ncbi:MULTISPECIES: hypothetical protein [Sorangium]|uniref:Uncharacterized protein n=1 Tax=Sorangium cellulosum TaxID=56 RepID=A0A4V0NGH6_SORCE|nr:MULTISPECIES: hypothetical protein [Sorangium]AUX33144.1 uncharacterized protein SOCE836_052980 [Sorangium cellulosum]AUX33202.1 uncharacterized protein SOCE836_053560 [Sorangium cellulosum]WCQ92520.1 hypothetical protein NQZ70_05261 [Sorangium sp. Soce836]